MARATTAGDAAANFAIRASNSARPAVPGVHAPRVSAARSSIARSGAVNGVGALVNAGASSLRRLQTGSVRTYAGSIVLGVVLILGYYLWR